MWVTKEPCLEVNDEKTKYEYIVTSCVKNEGQNHNKKKRYKSFESVTELEYLMTILTYPSCIYEEIMRRLESGNVW